MSYDVAVEPPDLVVARRPRPAAPAGRQPARQRRRGTAPPAASCGCGRRGGGATGWRLEVADDGPGIPDADRDRVFERFGTLDRRPRVGGGTGLGLAIARWVTDLHGGTIRFVDPEPPAGRAGARRPAARAGRPPITRPAQEAVMSSTAPRSRQPPVAVPAPTPARDPAAAPGSRAPAGPRPTGMDALFGSFWPDRGLPATSRAVLGAWASACSPAIVLPFRDPGSAPFLVLLAAGARGRWRFSVHRRSTVHPRPARGCASLLACGRRCSGTPTGSSRCACWPAPCSARSGVVHGRTLPAFVVWPASPGRWPGCAGCPGWAARRGPSPGTGSSAARAAHRGLVAARHRRVRAAVRLRRRALRASGSAPSCPT